MRLYTRNLKDAETYFPRLLSPPSWIEAREAIVDGEVVALDDAGRPDFGLLQERLGDAGAAGLVYQAFDLLYLDGRSLLAVALEDRKRLLKSVLRPHPRVRFAAHVVGDGKAFYEAAGAQGLEGVIAKLRRSPYEPGRRSPAWLKLKVRPEQELVVGGWTPGMGNARDLGALAVGVHEDGHLRFAGKVGSGFDGRTRRLIRERLARLEVDEPPFDPAPPRDYRGRWGGELRDIHWVRPGARHPRRARRLVARRHGPPGRLQGDRGGARSGGGHARAPDRHRRGRPQRRGDASGHLAIARGSRAQPTGRSPRDGPPGQATADELEALERLGKEGTWRIGGHDLKLTNLDKVLFAADPPVTKRELIGYFARIAPTMLPHLADRPLNLQRFPNGAGAPGLLAEGHPVHGAGLADRAGGRSGSTAAPTATPTIT